MSLLGWKEEGEQGSWWVGGCLHQMNLAMRWVAWEGGLSLGTHMVCSISMLHFETLLLSVQQFYQRCTPYIHTAAAQMLHPFCYLEQSCDVIQSSCCSWFRNCGWFTIMLLLQPGSWLTKGVENITSVFQFILVYNRKENLYDWTVYK